MRRWFVLWVWLTCCGCSSTHSHTRPTEATRPVVGGPTGDESQEELRSGAQTGARPGPQGLESGPLADIEELTHSPAMSRGRLSSGLRVWVQPHQRGSGKVEMFLAIAAGSVHEAADQRGAAYVASQWVSFQTETVSQGAAPLELKSHSVHDGAYAHVTTSSNDDAVAAALARLSAWSYPGTLSTASWGPAVQRCERALLKEKDRRSQPAYRHGLAVLTETPYGARPSNGTLAQLHALKPASVQAFVSRRYRPEHMALIVVGDVDRGRVQAMVERIFQRPASPSATTSSPVAPQGGAEAARLSTVHDPKSDGAYVSLILTQQRVPTRTQGQYRRLIMDRLLVKILRARLELIDRAAPSLTRDSTAHLMKWTASVESLLLVTQGRKGDAYALLERLGRALERARRHGLLPEEVSDQKTRLLKRVELAASRASIRPPREIAHQLVGRFLHHEVPVGLQQERDLCRSMLPSLTAETLHERLLEWTRDGSVLLTVTSAVRQDAARRAALLNLPQQLKGRYLSPWDGAAPIAELIDSLRPAGQVKARRELAAHGVSQLSLSNGVTVWVKPLASMKGKVFMRAVARGGLSLATRDELPSAINAGHIVAVSGVGRWSAKDLRRRPDTRSIRVRPWVARYTHGLQAVTDATHLEALLQLTYLHFTNLRADTVATLAWRKRQERLLMNPSPNQLLRERVQSHRYAEDPRRVGPSLKQLAMVRPLDSLRFMRKRLAHAGGYHLLFVGDVRPEELAPLLRRYVASLATGAAETSDPQTTPVQTSGEVTVRAKGLSRSTLRLVFSLTQGRRDRHHILTLIEALRWMIKPVASKFGATTLAARLNWQAGSDGTLTLSLSCERSKLAAMREALLVRVQQLRDTALSSQQARAVIEAANLRRRADQAAPDKWLEALESAALGRASLTTWWGDGQTLSPEELRALAHSVLRPENLLIATLQGR